MSSIPDLPLTSERVNHSLIPSITFNRLGNFFSGDYASQSVASLLNKASVDDEQHVSMLAWSAQGMDKPTFKEAMQGFKGSDVKTIKKGHEFGPTWTNHWIKLSLTIPEAFKKAKQQVMFKFDPNCESLLFTEDGKALHSLTGTNVQPGLDESARRTEHIIPNAAVKKGRYTIYIEVSCNNLFGSGLNGKGLAPPDMNLQFPILNADIILPNMAVRAMQTDFVILRQIAQSTQNKASDLPRRALKAANALVSAFHRVDGDEENPDLLLPVITECRNIAWEILGPLSDSDRAKLAPSDRKVQANAKVWAIGHCHIDTAWLWRYTQTQQKVARSWTTQCDLMDRWPNHQFAASSAQQYLWLEKLYPDAFDRVKKYIKDDRFHAVGGAWLEHDSNMPSGESLVRQYLYGQRYFKSRFGQYCKEAWLPDTFGYASQLPQILRQAGMKYFFTQKLSWNNITIFPYNTFNWIGLDGSVVLAHLAPADTYNCQCDFPELEKCIWNHKNVADAPVSLLLFGNGDGGGGPTPEMLNKLERLSSVAIQNGEVPSFRIGKPADFFDDTLKISKGGQTLPSWRGELYLEFHRGTYTTQANVKKGNRTMEILLHSLEYFATMARLSNKSYKYPRSELDEMWQDTMLNQFHDVLPGTTISLVVDDVLAIYKKRISQAEGLIESALASLYPGSQVAESAQDANNATAIDPLRLNRPTRAATNDKAYQEGDKYILENQDVKMTITKGRIVSFIDVKLQRELILAGPGAEDGGFIMYEDFPLMWDAWDVEVYHLESYRVLQFGTVKVDSTNAALQTEVKFGHSIVSATFSFGQALGSSSSSRSFIKIDTSADWQETHKILKFVLPVDIHSPHATYGTQFGLIERPTHRNTPYDQAKFEVCGHLLGDVSEIGYGVALASSWKYGYSIEGNVLRISLLRSPTTPDPTTDKGHHEFSFAIMPHPGYLQDSDTYKQAMAFCNPVYHRTGVSSTKLPTFEVQGPASKGIILETIKTAEDSDAIVLRMYEALGGRASGQLVISGVNIKSASWTNILEEQPEKVELKKSGDGVSIPLSLHTFEIKTMMLKLV